MTCLLGRGALVVCGERADNALGFAAFDELQGSAPTEARLGRVRN